jgi:lipopolysaccharide export system protein LptA
MRRRPDLAVALLVALVAPAAAETTASEAKSDQKSDQKGGGILDMGSFGNRKEPIVITADRLEYDYKENVVVYRGDVLAVQGDTKVRSDTMTITLAKNQDANGDGKAPPPAPPPSSDAKSGQKLQEVVAVGHVRIDNGTRWATGGRAVFEQGTRTLVLTESPVLHDGPNEVVGDRVVVYVDENRSVVEGGRKRVKATVFPGKEDVAGAGKGPAAPAATAAAAHPEAATP